MKVIKFFKKVSALIATCMMFSLIIQPVISNATTNEKVVNIYHTNDTHSRVNDFAVMKGYIDSQSTSGFILDAGDTYHGQSFATLQKGSSIAKILKGMGYTAMAPGNHDFNYGYKRLLELKDESGVPILAGNVLKDGKPLFNTTFIKEVNGIKFGIFGLATPETAYKTNPNNVAGLTFSQKDESINLAKSYVKELKAEGADVIIALTHLGIDPESDFKSTDVFSSIPEIDLLIDGHSHSPLGAYDSYNVSKTRKIVSSKQYLEFLGQVTFKFNADKTINEIIPTSVQLVKDKQPLFPVDQNIKNLVDTINNEQKPILDQVVGYTPMALDGRREVVRFGHSNLGRVLTSAMLHETKADIAITNGGGIRDSINAGEITKGEVIKVLPFGNYIVTKKLTGKEIVQALEHGMTIGSGSFTHYAGMKVNTLVYTETIKDSSGKEVSKEKHKVLSITVNGQPIDLNKEYVVATNDFMAVGGDGYTMFTGKPVINEFSALDESFIKYISETSSDNIVNDDKDVRLNSKTSFSKEESKVLITEMLKANIPFTFTENGDKGTFMVFTEGEKSVKFVISGTTVEEMNALVEEIKNPTVPPTPEVPNTGGDNGNTGNTGNNNSNNNGGTLPQTGGQNPTFVLIIGLALISAGIYFKKKGKAA